MASHAIHKRRGLVMIPLRQRTVVRLRSSRTGAVAGNSRAIIMGKAPASNYTRAYGPEYFVCVIKGHTGPYVVRKNGSEFMAAGAVKRIPASCREALAEYKRTYPSLAGAGRRRRRR